MSETILKGIPTFRILDYKKAMDFYVVGLGFEIEWEHRFEPEAPVYMQIFSNGLTLHLSENERFKTNVIVFVDCKGLTEFHKGLDKKSTKIKIPELLKTDWQTIQMELEDPFGNLLRFNETIVE